MALFAFDDDDVHLSRPGSSGDSGRPAPHQNVPQTPESNMKATIHQESECEMAPGTPPMMIMSPAPNRVAQLSKERKPQLSTDKLDPEMVLKKSQKKKKKKRPTKTGGPFPATTTVRGFQTPVTSGGEESDFSVMGTPRLGPALSGFSSITSSPALRPSSAAGGITNLKLQLESLNLGSKFEPPIRGPLSGFMASGISSNVSISGDSDRTEMESYEVNLEHDFVSSEAPSKTDAIANAVEVSRNPSLRKMTAQDFEPLTCLGKGSFGTVLLVKQRDTGRLYAQKQFRKASLTVHKRLVEQTKTERAILESVNRHPFVVKLFYAFQDDEKLYLILEYAQGGELFHHLANERMFSEDTAAFYMAEMILALDHLHRTVGVIYRDLKPENCLLDAEGHLLLTDFGLSKVAVDDDTTSHSFSGTVEYMAPEVIQGHEYGMAVDWWSLGALGFDLLTGSPPFTGPNNAKIQEKIVKQKLIMPFYISAEAKDLMTRLLRKEPKKRLGANMPKDLATIKAHRFFRKINWKKLEARELEPPIQPLITDPALAENFSTDFTDLALSPVATKRGFGEFLENEESNPFGGFSFVASASLIEGGMWSEY